jgi:hypothetical protein
MWDDATEMERELARVLRDSMNIDYPPDMPMDLNARSNDGARKRQWKSFWRTRVPKTTTCRPDPEG